MTGRRKFTAGKFNCNDARSSFSGYHIVGQYWNGFECPYFTKTTAARIMKRYFKRWKYDKTTDTFLGYRPEYKEWEDYSGQTITVSGKRIRVYAIGAWMWTWTLV
jgi:hypothetical protein